MGDLESAVPRGRYPRWRKAITRGNRCLHSSRVAAAKLVIRSPMPQNYGSVSRACQGPGAPESWPTWTPPRRWVLAGKRRCWSVEEEVGRYQPALDRIHCQSQLLQVGEAHQLIADNAEADTGAA